MEEQLYELLVRVMAFVDNTEVPQDLLDQITEVCNIFEDLAIKEEQNGNG